MRLILKRNLKTIPYLGNDYCKKKQKKNKQTKQKKKTDNSYFFFLKKCKYILFSKSIEDVRRQ